jgi:RHS repeat-associated protein
VNSSGHISHNSNAITVTTSPAAPTASAASGNTTTSFLAGWQAVSGITGYRLDVSLTNSFSGFVTGYNDLVVSTTSQPVTGLAPGTTYYYRVRAVNGSGASENSGTITAITKMSPPAAGVATNVTSDSFTATWENVTGATEYRLDVSIKQSFADFVTGFNNLLVSGLTKNVTGLTEKVTYYYRVRAVRTGETTGNSNTVTGVNLSQNYVRSISILKSGITSDAQVESAVSGEKLERLDFYDGLQRPLQTVLKKQSPLQSDIVQPVAYDNFGRESVKYLPYISGNNGWYKPDHLQQQAQFYQGTAGVAVDSKPFSEIIFESSPLNRPLKTFGPGQEWRVSGSEKFVEQQFLINIHGTQASASAEKVIAWKLDASGLPVRRAAVAGYIETEGYYSTGQLRINVTYDEHRNAVREYTNGQGQVILKKVQALAAGASDLNSVTAWAATYYLYDPLGNLRFVFPPELSKQVHTNAASVALTTDDLKNWAFQYTYDSQNRMSIKQVPGAGQFYMVYDTRDRLILTQDANLRKDAAGADLKKWLFTKYDAFNRSILTGIYTHASVLDQANMQTYVNSQMVTGNDFYEDYDGTSVNMGYTNRVFPKVTAELLTVTYYDGYDTNSAPSAYAYSFESLTDPETSQQQEASVAINTTRAKGLVTGTLVKNLSTGGWLRTVNHYDQKYRLVQFVSDHQKGIVRESTIIDFSGKPVYTKRKYTVNSVEKSIVENPGYDHAGRLVAVTHSVNGSTPVMIVKNEYNELGQLIDKKLHSADNGVTFKQSVDYRYNIRGWLTSINNSKLNNTSSNDDLNDLFGMELGYTSDLGLGSVPQYNGNIAVITWSNNTIESNVLQRGYAYSYDPLNRLTVASQKQALVFDTWTGGNYDENIPEYDLNGNIKALQRKDGSGNTIDNLTYGYGTGTAASNRLQHVHDTGDAAKGFINGNTGTDDYAYDANGNLISDKNKGITAITYNHLNLPVQVNKGPSNYIIYTYDATGRKLSQQVFGTGAKTTDYLSEMILENNALTFINFSDGRVLPDGANWEYQYHLKDHLGNVRTTFTAKEITTAKTATLETANVTAEQGEFLRFAEARKVQSFLFDRTNGSAPSTTTGYAQRLSGSANEKFGLAKSISVTAGDVVSTEVYAKYIDMNPSNRTAALNTLISQIALGTAGAGVVVDGGSLGSSTANFPFPGQAAQNTTGSSEAGPKAYLNWLVFKRDGTFVPAQSGYDRISTTPKETGLDVAHERLYSPSITITEPGFVYIYLSNEESTPVEVYFDDFKVTHVIKAPVVQTDDYYAFGLTFNSYSRENSVDQKYKFQGQEHIDDLDLGWDSFKWRNHMPDIGRFFNIDPLAEKYVYNSPYAFSENQVVAHRELEGLEKVGINENGFENDLDRAATNTTTVNRSGSTIGVTSTDAQGNVMNTTEIKLPSSNGQNNVSDQSAKTLGEVAMTANESSITISSTARTPEDQARIMYDKTASEGATSMKALYGAGGDKVVDVYTEKTSKGYCDLCTKSAMESKINEVGPTNVSNHTSDPAKLQVFDVAPSSVTNSSGFKQAIDNNTGSGKPISNRIHPGGSEKAYHIEIPQKKN